jgi:outer membrane protein assembly factor BamB
MNPKSKQFRSDTIYTALVIILLGGLILPPLSRSFWEFADQRISYIAALDGKTGNVLWSVFPDKIKVMSLTTHSGKLLIAGRDEKPSSNRQKDSTYHLLNLNSESGKQNWHFTERMTESNAYDVSLFNLEVSKQHLLLPFRPGSGMETQIGALDMNNGQVQWKISRPWGFGTYNKSGITTWENQSAVVKIVDTDILLQKYDNATGKKIWEVPIEKVPKWAKFPLQLGRNYRLRSTEQQILILNEQTNSLYVYDWANGNLKSKHSNFYPLSRQTLALNDLAVYHATGNTLQSSNLATGKGIWKVDLKRTKCDLTNDAAVLAQGLLVACSHLRPEGERKKYGSSFSRWLVLFNLQTGQQKWSQEILGLRDYALSAAVSSERIFVVREDRSEEPNEIIALDPTNGHIVWRKTSILLNPYISPVVDADRVVVLAQKPRWKNWFSFIPFK